MARGIQRLSKGRYRVRAVYTCPKTGRRRELRQVVSAQSVAEAEAERVRLREEALEEHRDRMRLADYAAAWLDGKRGQLRKSTAMRYATELDLHVLPALGQHWVDALTRADIVAWRDSQTGKPQTINSRLRTLRVLLRDATHELGLPRNPAEGVRAVSEAASDIEDDGRVLTPPQLRELLRWLEPEPLYPLFRLLAVTGLRWSEASALQWGDLDLEAGEVVIRRAHVNGEIGPPKTRSSRRRLSLDEQTAEVLQQHRRRLVAAQAPGLSDGWVFPSRVGTPLRTSAATKPIRRAVKAGALGYHPSPHWLRRTLNRLLGLTADQRLQMAIVGHSTDRMRLHYDHVRADEKRQAVGRVLALVDEGGHQSGQKSGQSRAGGGLGG